MSHSMLSSKIAGAHITPPPGPSSQSFDDATDLRQAIGISICDRSGLGLTVLRSSSSAARSLRTIAALLVAVPLATTHTLAGPRSPSQGGIPTTYDTDGTHLPRLAAAMAGASVASSPSRRSSALGNADFPERETVQQNLGNTASGGQN